MADRDIYRQAATECLEVVKNSAERSTRTKLVVLARKFLDLADKPENDGHGLDTLIDEFTDARMGSGRV
jgi:hypothetical protein